MQISKFSVAICATFVGVLPLAIHADTEAQARARQALEQSLSQPPPQATVTTNAPANPKKTVPTPAPTSAPTPAPTAKPASGYSTGNSSPAMSPEVTQKAQAALRKEIQEQQNKPVVVTPVPPVKPQPHVLTPPPVAQQIEAPPLPISASKEARLQELLVRYKADQISPEDYHRERAKILAEP